MKRVFSCPAAPSRKEEIKLFLKKKLAASLATGGQKGNLWIGTRKSWNKPGVVSSSAL